MAKISVNLSVVYQGDFKEEEKIRLASDKTVSAYFACEEALRKLGRLGELVEVIRVSFEQKDPGILLMRTSMVVVALSKRIKFQLDETLFFNQNTGISQKAVHERFNGNLRSRLTAIVAEERANAEALADMLRPGCN